MLRRKRLCLFRLRFNGYEFAKKIRLRFEWSLIFLLFILHYSWLSKFCKFDSIFIFSTLYYPNFMDDFLISQHHFYGFSPHFVFFFICHNDVCFYKYINKKMNHKIQSKSRSYVSEISFFKSSKHLLHRQLPSYSHSVMLAIYAVSALVKTAFIQSHCKILLTLQTNISPHLGHESGACFSTII